MTGPLTPFREMIRSGELKHDPDQVLAMEKLQALYTRLKTWQPRQGLVARITGRRRTGQEVPEGLYLYGGVGRGKSMMMDLFFSQVEMAGKQRCHFHEFMKQVHQTLHAWRQEHRIREGISSPLGGALARKAPDSMEYVADRMLGDCRLLCFDEFIVNNVVDAMILSRLFGELLGRGLVVVATSNTAPDDLYQDGLQRDRFLPFIALLKERMDVFEISSPSDYRLRSLEQIPVYFSPLGEQARRGMERSFASLAEGEPPHRLEVPIHGGRTLAVERTANGVAWFGFSELCEQALGVGDYLALAGRFHSILLEGIPQLGPERRNEARRLIMLIDALYEHRVNLVCSAEGSPHALYPAGEGAGEFLRTTSRMVEMQSRAWHAQPHIGTAPGVPAGAMEGGGPQGDPGAPPGEVSAPGNLS